MSEIAKLLQERVGLSVDQAESAENVVLEFIRSRVPAQYQGLLGSVLGGQPGTGDTNSPAGDAVGGLGGLIGAAEGMFGGSKE